MSSVLATVALEAAVVWFAYRLLRTPRDLGVYAVAAFVLLQFLAAPRGHGSATTTAVIKLLENVAQNISWYSLMLFFLLAAKGSARRAWWEAVPPVVTSAVMGVALLAIPAPLRDEVFPANGSLAGDLTGDMRIGGVAAFYLAGSCYFLYAITQSARWAARYAAESNARTRVGLQAAAAGLATLACVTAVRALFVVVRLAGGEISPSTENAVDQFVPLAGVVVLAGVSYPALLTRLATVRVWLRHRRIYQQLSPLWSLLHEAFPEDALDRQPISQWWDRLSPRRVHRRYWRRVVEIRDGLVQLSPQLIEVGFDPARPAYVQAGKLREALLLRQRDDQRPTSSKAVLVAAPESPDVQADVAELVRLAGALLPEGVASPERQLMLDRAMEAMEEVRPVPVDHGGGGVGRPRRVAYRGWRGPR